MTTRIWQVEFREFYYSSVVFDRVNVVARSAADALKKAKTQPKSLVPTSVTLLAEAD